MEHEYGLHHAAQIPVHLDTTKILMFAWKNPWSDSRNRGFGCTPNNPQIIYDKTVHEQRKYVEGIVVPRIKLAKWLVDVRKAVLQRCDTAGGGVTRLSHDLWRGLCDDLRPSKTLYMAVCNSGLFTLSVHEFYEQSLAAISAAESVNMSLEEFADTYSRYAIKEIQRALAMYRYKQYKVPKVYAKKNRASRKRQLVHDVWDFAAQ